MDVLLPRDTTDLALGPVALRLDEELRLLDGLTPEELIQRLLLETGWTPRTAEQRRTAVLARLTRFVDLHGWRVDLDDRGVRLEHGNHSVTLGLPDVLRSYLSG